MAIWRVMFASEDYTSLIVRDRNIRNLIIRHLLGECEFTCWEKVYLEKMDPTKKVGAITYLIASGMVINQEMMKKLKSSAFNQDLDYFGPMRLGTQSYWLVKPNQEIDIVDLERSQLKYGFESLTFKQHDRELPFIFSIKYVDYTHIFCSETFADFLYNQHIKSIGLANPEVEFRKYSIENLPLNEHPKLEGLFQP
ncbi:hypothetical protein [Woodsholea maritima]|uniref:hypothetical protein n=1 Tax=Woodsholea maritima TaxID=240237 RepID=UPI000376FB02|nr:hypothetical protein [Woodsholea maritima]